MKRKSPCCGVKAHPHKVKLWRCPKCGGTWQPEEVESGRIEGGDYFSDPSRRLQIAEGRIDTSRPIVCYRPSTRGGL